LKELTVSSLRLTFDAHAKNPDFLLDIESNCATYPRCFHTHTHHLQLERVEFRPCKDISIQLSRSLCCYKIYMTYYTVMAVPRSVSGVVLLSGQYFEP
jgi:hypothetical protein